MEINRNEVLRYLGYNGQHIDNTTNTLIDECILETKQISQPNYTYEIFNIQKTKDKVLILDTNLILHGNDIYNHLKSSNKCALMAVSLGLNIDRQITYYSKINITNSIILDSCASSYVESLCDYVQNLIKEDALLENKHITTRFSPGYGDLSINIQNNLINVLQTHKKIGLTTNQSNILIPRKSVTAIIGFQNKACQHDTNKCRLCNNLNCQYRKV